MVEQNEQEKYYFRHFVTLLTSAVARYGDLLTAQEHSVVDTFKQLPRDAAHLYVRLFMRRHRWFTLQQAFYEQLQPTSDLLDILTHQGFVSRDPPAPEELEEALSILTRKELSMALGARESRAKKAELLERVATKYDPRHTPLPPMVRVHHKEHFTLLARLYFGNLYQDLTVLILEELNVRTFPEFQVSPERLWQHRHEIDSWLRAEEIRGEMVRLWDFGELEKLHELAQNIPILLREAALLSPPSPWGHNEGGVFARAAAWYGGVIDKVAPGDAREWLHSVLSASLPRKQRVALEERLAIILRREGRRAEIIDLVRHIKSRVPLTLPEETQLAKCTTWLARRRPQRYVPPEHIISLVPASGSSRRHYKTAHGSTTVEDAVLGHLKTLGYEGLHTENWIIPTMAALLFHDEIFLPCPGVFQSPFQTAPLDFGTMEFFESRREQFRKAQERLEHLPSPARHLLSRYETLAGTALRNVRWDKVPPEFLIRFVEATPWRGLLKVLLHYLRHPSHHGAGMPDLALIGPHGSGGLFAEVKTPNDTLSGLQTSWLQTIEEAGIPVLLIRVTETPP